MSLTTAKFHTPYHTVVVVVVVVVAVVAVVAVESHRITPNNKGCLFTHEFWEKTLHTDASKHLARQTNDTNVLMYLYWSFHMCSKTIYLNKSPELSVYPNLDLQQTKSWHDSALIGLTSSLASFLVFFFFSVPALRPYLDMADSHGVPKGFIKMRSKNPHQASICWFFVYYFQKEKKHIIIRRKNTYHMTYYCFVIYIYIILLHIVWCFLPFSFFQAHVPCFFNLRQFDAFVNCQFRILSAWNDSPGGTQVAGRRWSS